MAESKSIAPEKMVTLKHNLDFYHDKLGLFILVVFLSLLTVIGVTLICIIQENLVPPPTFFKATVDEQIIEEGPLDTPYVPSNTLLNWTAEAAMAIYAMNFKDKAQILENVKTYFTDEGYQMYLDLMKDKDINAKLKTRGDTSILDELTNTKSVMRATPKDAPKITLEGVADLDTGKAYSWVIELPVTLNFYRSNASNLKEFKVVFVAIRVPTLSSQIGVKIAKIRIEPNTK